MLLLLLTLVSYITLQITTEHECTVTVLQYRSPPHDVPVNPVAPPPPDSSVYFTNFIELVFFGFSWMSVSKASGRRLHVPLSRAKPYIVVSHWSRPLSAAFWLAGRCYRVVWGERETEKEDGAAVV